MKFLRDCATHFGLFRSATPAEAPCAADDIDIDRVIWDPAYRRTVKDLLNTEADRSADR